LQVIQAPKIFDSLSRTNPINDQGFFSSSVQFLEICS